MDGLHLQQFHRKDNILTDNSPVAHRTQYMAGCPRGHYGLMAISLDEGAEIQ